MLFSEYCPLRMAQIDVYSDWLELVKKCMEMIFKKVLKAIQLNFKIHKEKTNVYLHVSIRQHYRVDM